MLYVVHVRVVGPQLISFHIYLLFLSPHVCRLVAKPCAHILQIQAGASRRAQPNALLERVFTSTTVRTTTHFAAYQMHILILYVDIKHKHTCNHLCVRLPACK